MRALRRADQPARAPTRSAATFVRTTSDYTLDACHPPDARRQHARPFNSPGSALKFVDTLGSAVYSTSSAASSTTSPFCVFRTRRAIGPIRSSCYTASSRGLRGRTVGSRRTSSDDTAHTGQHDHRTKRHHPCDHRPRVMSSNSAKQHNFLIFYQDFPKNMLPIRTSLHTHSRLHCTQRTCHDTSQSSIHTPIKVTRIVEAGSPPSKAM